MAHEVRSVALPTGVTLKYVEQGDPSGVTVLLLPGTCDTWRSFGLLLPHLPESIRAFAVTQRGHGDSSKPDRGYRYRDFAADAAALIDTLGLGAAVVLGHSSGSTNGLYVAIDHPDAVLGLVLVAGDYDVVANPAVREFWEGTVSQMDDPADPGFVRELQESSAGDVPVRFLDRLVRDCRELPARAWKGMFESFLSDDFAQELHRITAPTLIVWGDQDEITPRREGEALSAAIADSRFLVYEGVGHSPHWEVPERFASDLVSFVETVSD